MAAEVSGAVGSVFASAWYHANPANERGPIVYGWMIALYMSDDSTARPHLAYASGGVHTSTFVPPQFAEISPTGTTLSSAAARPSAIRLPKNQHTAEKVAKRWLCGPKSLRIEVLLATCHGSHTVARSRSGVGDDVRWPTEKKRICGYAFASRATASESVTAGTAYSMLLCPPQM